jgi:hypothetical protein
MTDKEWKELCEWAEKLGSKRIVVGYNEFVGEKSIYIYSVGVNFFCSDKIGLVIQQDGSISNGRTYIAKNRTPQQIKSIIENLL